MTSAWPRQRPDALKKEKEEHRKKNKRKRMRIAAAVPWKGEQLRSRKSPPRGRRRRRTNE